MRLLFLFITLSSNLFSEHYYHLDDNGKVIGFDLLDPETAPKEIRSEVMLGFSILQYTKKYAPKYVGNALSCTNCHFNEGNTLGGKNGSFSLVGVMNVYPKHIPGTDKIVTIEERIQNCFKRSLNGKAPPVDSSEMKAIISYLKWIGNDVKVEAEIPWLGIKTLKSKHTPNLKAGKITYQKSCRSCHREHGEGEKKVPPIFGDGSFNKGAGLNRLQTLAAFIYWNMPNQMAPLLTEEQALDVAAYVLSQPRPDYIETE